MIGPDETVVCDFGGTYSLDGDVGYCSDITRTVVTGPPPTEVAECYEVLLAAQQAAVDSARRRCRRRQVDQVARDVIDAAGLGDFFVHRTGHGIGIEEHEDPYLVVGNGEALQPGHAFSVEPGIYLPGGFGMRLEDIVVIGADGAPNHSTPSTTSSSWSTTRRDAWTWASTGKVALVTAGSQGLGRATAVALAAEGVRVMVSARDAATLEADAGRAVAPVGWWTSGPAT